MPAQLDIAATGLIDQVEFFRLDANRRLASDTRSQLGQFMTPPAVAMLLASMVSATERTIRLLDAGAGVGSLSAAVVAALLAKRHPPRQIEVTAFEIDPLLVPFLEQTLEVCRQHCESAGVEFAGQTIVADFVEWASDNLSLPVAGWCRASPRAKPATHGRMRQQEPRRVARGLA